MAAYKTCKKCGRSLPMTKKYFNENVTSKDGFQSYCRSCQKKVEVANAMKQMRRGVKPKKPPRFKSPKIPKYSEIFNNKKNSNQE